MTSTIVCRDHGTPPLQSIKHVIVDVVDENDNNPRLESHLYNVTAQENNPIGGRLLQLVAHDNDTGVNGVIEYMMTSSRLTSLATEFLRVNSSSGVVVAVKSFDRERLAKLEFEVVASDRGDVTRRSDSARVVISITDVNDEAPLFSDVTATFSLTENNTSGAEVGKVAAIDADLPPFNDVTYAILPRNDSHLFHIDSQTGHLYADVIADRETVTSYYITVAAYDAHNSSLFSCLDVRINVDDVNDNQPHFLFPSPHNNTVLVSPRAPRDFLVTQLVASDADIGDNARLSYDTTSGNDALHFFLHKTSGFVSIDKEFEDDVMWQEFELQVRVRDGGQPSLFSSATLRIVVDADVEFGSGSTNTNLSKSEGFPRMKLILIVTLSLLSIFLFTLLAIAIALVLRGQRSRRLKRKQQLRMEGLAKLTVANNNHNNVEEDDDVTQEADENKQDHWSNRQAPNVST